MTLLELEVKSSKETTAQQMIFQITKSFGVCADEETLAMGWTVVGYKKGKKML